MSLIDLKIVAAVIDLSHLNSRTRSSKISEKQNKKQQTM